MARTGDGETESMTTDIELARLIQERRRLKEEERELNMKYLKIQNALKLITDGGRIHRVGTDSLTTERSLSRKEPGKEDLLVLPPNEKIMAVHNRRMEVQERLRVLRDRLSGV